MQYKITFEMSEEAAMTAALNAGAESDEEAGLFAIGIKRNSKMKMVVNDANQYKILIANQRAGYHVIAIEPATN